MNISKTWRRGLMAGAFLLAVAQAAQASLGGSAAKAMPAIASAARN
jgi:hypothetical protein